jgi:hypothetical protein
VARVQSPAAAVPRPHRLPPDRRVTACAVGTLPGIEQPMSWFYIYPQVLPIYASCHSGSMYLGPVQALRLRSSGI